jgi:hypothetical protein
MSLEYILNICYLGWILNFSLYVVLIVLLIIKQLSDRENIASNNLQMALYNEQRIFLKKDKNKRLLQKVLGWVIPYYTALLAVIWIAYILNNFKRNIVDIVIELDYITDSYRIFKRY